MNLPDFNNLGHILGGAVAAYLAIKAVENRNDESAVVAMGMVAAFVVNAIWEVLIDFARLWPDVADPAGFDVLDIFLRGGIGGIAVCGYWLLRRQ